MTNQIKSASQLNALTNAELTALLKASSTEQIETFYKFVALRKNVKAEISEELNVRDEMSIDSELSSLLALESEEIETLELEAVNSELELEAVYAKQTEPETAKPETEDVFNTLETNDNFRMSLDTIQAAIALNAPATANEVISAEKARLTNINRVSRSKRFDKMKKLNDRALSFIVNNSTPDQIESTAIYAVDKVIQITRALSGDSAVFGRGKNNTLLYTLYGIAKQNLSDLITTAYISGQLTRYGQPHESAQTQASSSLKALLSLDCIKAESKAGVYSVNQKSDLMKLLLSEYSK